MSADDPDRRLPAQNQYGDSVAGSLLAIVTSAVFFAALHAFHDLVRHQHLCVDTVRLLVLLSRALTATYRLWQL